MPCPTCRVRWKVGICGSRVGICIGASGSVMIWSLHAGDRAGRDLRRVAAEFDVGTEDEAEIKEKVGRNTFAAGIRALASRS